MLGSTRTNLAFAGLAALAAATSAQSAVITVEVNDVMTYADIVSTTSFRYDLDGDGSDDIVLGYERAIDLDTLFSPDSTSSPPTGLTGALSHGDSLPTGFLTGKTRLLQFQGGSTTSAVTGGCLNCHCRAVTRGHPHPLHRRADP